MTSQEFVLWLKGFTEGVHEYNITPKQWDLLKEKLAEVEDKTLILESPKFPFGTPNTYPPPIGVPYTTPHDPYNPFKVYCDSSSGSFGTTTPPMTITTTPGTGYVTFYNPIQFDSVTVVEDYSMFRNIPPEELTDKQLIKILKGEDRWSSISSKDDDVFTELRFALEEQGYLKVQRMWSNGDEVLKPFYLNGVLFEKGDRFPCAPAMKYHIVYKEKYGE